jgi:hypothetical protein
MADAQILEESRLIDLTDEQLVDLVGSLFESIKRLDEAAKVDPEIERLQAELKSYRDDMYMDRKKQMVRRLKAARAHAKVRNLVFNLSADT